MPLASRVILLLSQMYLEMDYPKIPSRGPLKGLKKFIYWVCIIDNKISKVLENMIFLWVKLKYQLFKNL
jgi:hypothetical protein